jgi:O-antigen ligase
MIEFSEVFIFFLMIVTLIDTQKDVEVFLWIFGILTCFMAYDAVYNYTHGIIVESWGGDAIGYAVTSGGMGTGHVQLANMILQGMPFLWFIGMCNRGKLLKLAGVILFSLCLYGVIVSGSRGGFIGLVVLLFCLTIFSKNKLLMIGLGVFLIFSIPIIAGSNYMDYMNKALSPEILDADLSAGSRVMGLSHGIEMLIKRPILGVGPGCYPVARKAWFSWGLWAHNHYGELMGELGIVGTFVWFTFSYNYLKKSMQLRKLFQNQTTQTSILTAVIVSTIVRLALGMATHSVYIFFWYMMAGVISVMMRLNSNMGSTKESISHENR